MPSDTCYDNAFAASRHAFCRDARMPQWVSSTAYTDRASSAQAEICAVCLPSSFIQLLPAEYAEVHLLVVLQLIVALPPLCAPAPLGDGLGMLLPCLLHFFSLSLIVINLLQNSLWVRTVSFRFVLPMLCVNTASPDASNAFLKPSFCSATALYALSNSS